MGPFTGNGGSNTGAGAGGAAGDAGQSTSTLARDDAYDLSAEAVSSVPAAGVLANDDVNGAEIVTRSLTTRLGGSVELALDGGFVYTPPADPGALPRVDDFTYTLSGPEGESSATVLLTLAGTPTAADDYFGTTVDTVLVLEPPGVLENDDPRGAAISSYDATSTAGGSVVLDGSGAFVYVPADNFVGEDSFQYTLTSVAGESTALVVIQVGREPLAANDSYISSKGERFSPTRTVLENDSLGAPAARIVSFGGGSLGGTAGDHLVGTNTIAAGSLITVRADGAIIFVPEASFVGTFQLLYSLENEFGVSEGSVVIEVHEAALAVDDHFDLLAGSTLSVAAGDDESLLANDVGTPAPVITTFGGGSLGGTVADHAAGDTVDTGTGSLTVNADGSISYVSTPEASGELSFDYHIENAAGNDEGTVTITVAHAPEITSADTLTLQAGTANNLPFAITATGTPEPTVSVTGELPDGVTFSDGSLIGTADAESGGTYELTVTAQNGVDPDDIQLLNITVETQAVLTGEPDATFTVGTGGSYLPTLVAGVPSPTLSLSGSLPDGLVFNTETGEISGIPEQETGGTYLLEITANNGIVAPVVLAVTLEVLESPEITSAEEATFEVGQAGTFTVVVSSNPESTLNVLGTLPTGVTFNPATGILSGTPAPGQGGEHLLAFEASNGVSPDTLQDFTLVVNEAPGLTGGATAAFTVGNSGTYTATATGFPEPTFSFVGALPAGLSFNAATGTISGTPGVGTSGTYPVTIGASNGIGTDASLAVTVDVSEVSNITSANAATFTVGALGSFQVTASGTPAPALSLTGTLPTGLTFSPITGVLSGTPDVGTGGIYSLTIGADNSVGVPGTQSFTLTVEEAPSLIGAATTTFVVGQSNTYSTVRTGFPLPTLGLTGTLPDGLSFDATAGTISGTADPGTGGTYSLTLTASNGVLLPATVSLTLTVEEGGAFTSDDETTFTVGTPGTFTVVATGTPAPTLSVQESLPNGITFTPGTGELAGTPAAGSGGTYTLTFEANNGIGTPGSQTFTLTINEAPALTGAATTTFVVGTPGSYTPAVLGFPAPTLSLTGSLPSGLSFDAQTGAISGTAQAGTGGSYPVTIGATNGIGSAASLAVTITVSESAQITSGNATTFVVGTPGSFNFTATGTPAPTFSVTSGTLPNGVTLSSGGLLSGTPAASTGATYPITISASNGVGSAATQSFTLTVNEAPGLDGAATATFQVAQSGSYSFSSTGFPAPTLSLTGNLPSGLSFNAATGTITGTPGSGTAGSYPVTIGADNGVGSVASLALTITVTDPATITSANATTFTVGSPGSFTVTASGTPAPTLSQSGTLPTGVTFSPATGLLSGTPAAGTGGTYSLTFGASNGVGSAASQSFTLTVNEAPGLSGSATTTFVVGTGNSYTPTFTGFPAATFGITGSLPSGLSFSTSTGVISGTAQSGTGGSYPVTISASNGVGSAATLGVTISVTQAPAITSANATTFTVGSPGSFSVTASGTPASSFSVTAGSLPSGVTLSSSGLLSGTPAASTGGTYPITISASNGVGSTATQSFTLTVNQAPSISGTPPSPVDADAAYSHTFTLSGFPAPTTSVVSGTLPTGLTLSSSGALTGTPTTPGTFSSITVRASNSVSTADITFTIVVNVAVPPPSATADSFAATGNIAIDVPVGSSVLSNDTLNTATLTGFGPTSGTATAQTPGGSSATAQGGTVTVAADGSFSYDPPAGVTGSDSFAYTIANAGGSSVGTVTITISNRVWFVDAGAAGGGNGKPATPFQALTSVTSTASGDVIYALRSVTPYAAKTLSAGQRLLGQGITPNATHLGFTLAPLSRSSIFGTAGSNSTMRTLTLASNVYVRGFDVAATSGNRGLVGVGAALVDVAGMNVSASSAAAVDLSSGSGSVSLRSVTASGGSNGILLTGMTGSFTITGDGGNTANNSGGTISGTTSDAVRLNSAQNVSISSLGISSIPSGFYGIHGNSINNLSLLGVTTSGGTQGLMFEDNNGTPANLTGTVVIRNCTFSNHTTLIGLRNEVGTISSFTLENNTFSTATSTGILLQIRGTASVTDMSVKGNTFTNVSTTLSTNAFNLFVGTNTTASTTLTPFIKVTFENNTFTGSNGIPIRMRVIETDGTLHAIVRNNSVSGITGTNTNAMRVDSGNSSGNSIVCLQVQNNSFTPSGTAFGIAVRRDTTDTFGIVGLTPSPSSVATDVTSFINSQNPGNTSQVVVGATAFANGYTSCTIP